MYSRAWVAVTIKKGAFSIVVGIGSSPFSFRCEATVVVGFGTVKVGADVAASFGFGFPVMVSAKISYPPSDLVFFQESPMSDQVTSRGEDGEEYLLKNV